LTNADAILFSPFEKYKVGDAVSPIKYRAQRMKITEVIDEAYLCEWYDADGALMQTIFYPSDLAPIQYATEEYD
jgi:uncharacterized protein YodC (DUF2158 family)